jgi:hypothetical protein
MKISLLIISLVAAFAASGVQAQTSVMEMGTVTAERNAQKFMVKSGTIGYEYEEPNFMKIHGRLYEISTSYRRAILSSRIPMFYGGELMGGFGNTTYDGGIQSADKQVTPMTSSSKDRIIVLEGKFGASFVDTSVQSLGVYGGLGYWALNNKIDGNGSYTREVTYLYLPVGVEYNLKLGSSVTMVFGAQYNLFLVGTVKSHLSEVDSSLPDIDNSQTSGRGYKLRVAPEVNFASWTAFLEGYYQSWSIGDSDHYTVISGSKMASFMEPANETRMLGINIGARF